MSPLVASIPAAADAHAGGFVRDLLVILATAGLVALALRRLHMAVVPGYLIAGAIIGPFALGLVGHTEASVESIASISNLAVVLLMFTIGLHLDIGDLRGRILSMSAVGVGSTLAATLLGWPVAMLFGLSGTSALVLAMAISISSTAVVLRLLQQRRELHRVRGRLCFGVLLVQDLVAITMLALVPALGAWASGDAVPVSDEDAALSGPGALLAHASLAIGGVAALIVAGKLILPRLLSEAAAGSAESGGEVLLVVSSAVALGAAAITTWIGLSPELGAFLAGFLLSATPVRFQIAGQLAPVRDLLMAVFFTTVGLKLPVEQVAHGWWIIVLGVLTLVAIKAAAIGIVTWAAGATGAVAVYVGLALAQGGEFSLVMLDQAEEAGAITETAGAYGIAIVVVSLVATPLLIDFGRNLAGRAAWVPLARSADPAEPAASAESEAEPKPAPACGRAIIAGFGPVGRAVAVQLEEAGVPYTVVELNPRTVQKQADLGRSIVYGDAANAEVLESAGFMEAEAVILTMPDEEAMLRACRLIRELRPDVFIAARANVLSKGMQAIQFGANHVVVEEVAAAEAMGDQVITKLQERARERQSAGPQPADAATDKLSTPSEPGNRPVRTSES